MTQPNVVWIMCDELRASALSCYGTRFESVRTPNIDRIAQRGVRFSNVFATSPICVPMRTSLMTAAHPETTGVYGNEGAWASYPYDRDLVTFPELFARAGYETVNFGKTHLPRSMQPWQIDDNRGAQGRLFFDGVETRPEDEIGLPGMPRVKIGGHFTEDHPFPGEEVTQRSLAWLDDREEDTPFLLRISYLQPHTPVVPPPPFAGRYRDEPWGDPRDLGSAGSAFERRVGEVLGTADLTTEEVHRIQADYHALVAWVDAEIGRVVEHLEARGMLDDVILIFSADHGVSLGEGNRLLKHTFAPESHRIPQIISWPGRLPAGDVRSEVCESLDLVRTLCALTGVPPADTFEGRDLFGSKPTGVAFATLGYGEPDSLHTPNAGNGTWSDGGGWPRRSCIRTDRYRLDMTTRRNGKAVTPDEEDLFLCDVVEDPAERVNRANDPDLAETRAGLRQQLLDHVADGYEPPFVPRRAASELGVH